MTQVANGLSAEGIIGIINAVSGNLTGQQAANGQALSNYFSSASGNTISPLGSDTSTDTAAAPAATGTSWMPIVILIAAAAGVIYFLKRKKGA